MNEDQPQTPFLAPVVFLSMLTAAILLAVEIWLPNIGSDYVHSPGKSAFDSTGGLMGCIIKAAIVFAAALAGAARLPYARFAAAFFIGVFSSVLYEVAMIFGVFPDFRMIFHTFPHYTPEFSRYIINTVVYCIVAGVAAGLFAQFIVPAYVLVRRDRMDEEALRDADAAKASFQKK